MNNLPTRQDYGADPLAVRDSEKYQEEYVQSFVDKWDELIDWDGRAKAEGQFFIEQLKERGAKKVLDVAAGTGYHSVQLLEAGELSGAGAAEAIVEAVVQEQARALLPDIGTTSFDPV